MMRLEGWELRLVEVIERHGGLPFSWPENNCFYFPMNVAQALTGTDPWAHERGCGSEGDFARRLLRHGFRHVGEAFAAVFEPMPLALARRGDIGVIEQHDGSVIGVVVEGAQLIGVAPGVGVQRVSRELLRAAFKVG